MLISDMAEIFLIFLRFTSRSDAGSFINSELLAFFIPELDRDYVFDPPFEMKFQQVNLPATRGGFPRFIC